VDILRFGYLLRLKKIPAMINVGAQTIATTQKFAGIPTGQVLASLMAPAIAREISQILPRNQT
jgi:hypothetical protein